MIRTKSVWSPVDRGEDGLRILTSRFRGRGLQVERYDAWLPALGPSEELLRRFQSGGMTWAAYSRAYVKELLEDGPVDARCATIKNHGQKSLLRLLKQLGKAQDVTLMCVCPEDTSHCHRYTLQKLIAGPRV
ncbi:MAG TPA: DUF488 domain-containing protein [Usitatibacter sp.]|jgi:uncharacterized protein YeaO (DUF488 family)|nr:DUF488 domain-containing protein [Usitatibacter sp.]